MAMARVFVVTAGEREDYCIIDVFDDAELAEKCRADNSDNSGNLTRRVEEWPITRREAKMDDDETVDLDASLNINPGDPKIGDRVTFTFPTTGVERKGRLVGVEPPEMLAQGHGWRCLVKWNDTSFQDSWHDAGDLEFDDAPPMPGCGT